MYEILTSLRKKKLLSIASLLLVGLALACNEGHVLIPTCMILIHRLWGVNVLLMNLIKRNIVITNNYFSVKKKNVYNKNKKRR